MNTLVELVETVLKPLWVVMVMVAFVGIVWWAYRPRNKGRFESYGDIPLKDDDQAPGAPSNSSPAKPAKER